jgi:hypothetical protein
MPAAEHADGGGQPDLERAAVMWVRMLRAGELGKRLTLDDV